MARKLSKENDLIMADGMLLFWESGTRHMLRICQDSDPIDPRSDYEGPSVMACFCGDYKLGDDINTETPGEFWAGLLDQHFTDDGLYCAIMRTVGQEFLAYAQAHGADINKPADITESFRECVKDGAWHPAAKVLEGHVAWLPLWVYDHSGITVSCGDREYPYNDRFDSSPLGFIIMAKEDAMRDLGCLENDWLQKALACMADEVSLYDKYLTGDMWFYTLYDCASDSLPQGPGKKTTDEDDWIETVSCAGFEGPYLMVSGIPDEDILIENGLKKALESGCYETGTTSEKITRTLEFHKD